MLDRSAKKAHNGLMNNTATARPNTYAGPCATCGAHVAAAAGILGAKINGRWTVAHATCPTTPAPARTYAAECDAGHRRPVKGCYCCDHGIGA